MLVAYAVAIDLVRQLRPIVEQIKMHDAHLADQLKRAATNTVATSPKGRGELPETNAARTRTRTGKRARCSAASTAHSRGATRRMMASRVPRSIGYSVFAGASRTELALPRGGLV
jgi:hypothetical protein